MKAVALPGVQPLREFSHLDAKLQFSLAVLLLAMLAVGAWVALVRRPSLGLFLTYVPFAVAWLRLDQNAEGRILVAFGDSHGLTESDLLPFVIGALALAVQAYKQESARPPARGPAHRR